jgi:hypothetical protein
MLDVMKIIMRKALQNKVEGVFPTVVVGAPHHGRMCRLRTSKCVFVGRLVFSRRGRLYLDRYVRPGAPLKFDRLNMVMSGGARIPLLKGDLVMFSNDNCWGRLKSSFRDT